MRLAKGLAFPFAIWLTAGSHNEGEPRLPYRSVRGKRTRRWFKSTPPDFDDEELTGDEPAKPICGAETWNELDGENYRCMLPVHGPKVKHGCWRKI